MRHAIEWRNFRHCTCCNNGFSTQRFIPERRFFHNESINYEDSLSTQCCWTLSSWPHYGCCLVCSVTNWCCLKTVDVRFIEYMPFGGNKWNDKKIVPYIEMVDIIKRKFPDMARLKDKPNDTSKVCSTHAYGNFYRL